MWNVNKAAKELSTITKTACDSYSGARKFPTHIHTVLITYSNTYYARNSAGGTYLREMKHWSHILDLDHTH